MGKKGIRELGNLRGDRKSDSWGREGWVATGLDRNGCGRGWGGECLSQVSVSTEFYFPRVLMDGLSGARYHSLLYRV